MADWSEDVVHLVTIKLICDWTVNRRHLYIVLHQNGQYGARLSVLVLYHHDLWKLDSDSKHRSVESSLYISGA